MNTNSNHKNILFLIPHLGRGGAERSLSIVSKHMEQVPDVHNVYVCVFSNSEEIYYEYGGTLIELDQGLPSGKISRWRGRYKKLKSLKKEKKITHTISFLEGANYLNIKTKVLDKTIISIRGSKQFDKEIAGKSGWLRKKILIPGIFPKADLVIPITETMAQEMNQYFLVPLSKQKVIPNFYEHDTLIAKSNEPIPEEYAELFERKFTMISSGRLHIQKSFDAFIKVFHALKKKRDAQVVILGNGTLKPSLIQLASDLNLRTFDHEKHQLQDGNDYDVYFLGHQKNPFNLIKNADLFVMMSGWEGFPNALAEAMIVGTPVISTDCPTGPRDLIASHLPAGFGTSHYHETDYGFLMPLFEDTPELLAQYVEVISKLIDEPELRKAKVRASTERMISFTKENVLNMWLEIIED